MAEGSILNALQGDVKEFSALVGWSGPEDKPFYRALLVSQLRAEVIENRPFWGYAVISADELRRLVATLLTQGQRFLEGRHSGAGSEYYVDTDVERLLHFCSLGFDRDTLRALRGMSAALEADHRAPIEEIENRIRPALEQGSF